MTGGRGITAVSVTTEVVLTVFPDVGDSSERSARACRAGMWRGTKDSVAVVEEMVGEGTATCLHRGLLLG